MARESIDKATVRNRLPAKREPYWGAPVARGLYVGFRKLDAGWGNWIARYRDDDGRQHYKAIGPVSDNLNYEAARKAAAVWLRAVTAGVDTNSIRTVSDACREYVAGLRKAQREAAAHDADMRFRRVVYDRTIGKTELARIAQKRIEAWRDDLVEPASADQKPLSRSSANRTLIALKAALNAAVTARSVSADRAIEWKQAKAFKNAEKRRDLFLDLTQRRALLGASKGAIRDLMEGVMLTGARAGELTGATCGRFDKRTGSIALVGKTGERKVPVSPDAIKLFTRLAKGKLPGARLFTRDDGKPWAHSDWDELVRAAAEQARLAPGVCLYTLRHSFITTAILEGLTPLEVARLVGTSLTMIDRHYGHLAQTSARERLAVVRFT